MVPRRHLLATAEGSTAMTTPSIEDPQVRQSMDDPQVRSALGGSAEESEASLSEASDNCACTLFAVINANGTVVRGLGVASAQRFGNGLYEVIFNRNVSRCAYVATLGDPSTGVGPPGEIGVASRVGNVNGVFMTTRDSAGTLADRPYHLAVHCRS
jgi:hypothetical protein